MNVRGVILAAAVAGAAGPAVAEKPETAEAVTVSGVLVKVIEEVEVPARERGVLSGIAVSEGEVVSEGDLLAQIEDEEARLAAEQAQIDLDIARREAANDIDIRFARKSEEVARAELRRATDAVAQFARSVSETELDRLRLTAEQAALEIEQAQEDLHKAQLELKSKKNQLKQAELKVERRKIVAPLEGMVVEVNRHAGEWVEPGETVLRVLRINRLRAEGFLDADQAVPGLKGRPVKLTVDIPGGQQETFVGELVFVSPEVNAVNGQARVWAEVENRGMLLRPGLEGRMTILPAEPEMK